MVKEYRVLRGVLSVRPAPHPSPSDPSNPSGQNVEAQHYAIFVPSLKFPVQIQDQGTRDFDLQVADGWLL